MIRRPGRAAALALVLASTTAACTSSGSDGRGSSPTGPAADTRAVLDWFSGVRGDLAAIQKDQYAIADAASSQDATAVDSVCQQLKDDVVTFEADPAAPDTVIREDLAHAMDAYSTAATECLAGDYESSASDLDTGTSWLARTTKRVQALS